MTLFTEISKPIEIELEKFGYEKKNRSEILKF